MGKRLTQQKRGKGSPAYKAPSHRFKARTGFRNYDALEKESSIRGEIIGFLDDPGHQSLLMEILFENGDISVLPATEGLKIGDHIDCGVSAKT
ncbi:MAG: 50S ribosomal protein L2, partial [Candidatus Micrarchaeia archaeon]